CLLASILSVCCLFFSIQSSTTEIYTLSLHDALPIWMAMLSSHPGIVTIYEVGVSPDDRPYLTMEYCPHGHFGVIARAHPLTVARDRKSTRLNSSHVKISYAVFCLKKKKKPQHTPNTH